MDPVPQTTVDDITSIYSAISNIPTVSGGRFLPNSSSSELEFFVSHSQTDLHTSSRRSFVTTGTLTDNGLSTTHGLPSGALGSLSTPSPSGKYVAVVKKIKTSPTAPPPAPMTGGSANPSAPSTDLTLVEVWTVPAKGSMDAPRVVASIDGSSIHGSVYSDRWFASLSWSHDERFLAYIAEASRTSSKPLTGSKKAPSSKDDDDADGEKKSNNNSKGADPSLSAPGKVWDYEEDYGEDLVGSRNPSVIVVDFGSDGPCGVRAGPLKPIVAVNGHTQSPQLACGQLAFAPSSHDLVFTGWQITPPRLGIRSCYNRPASLFSLDVAASASAAEQAAKRRKEIKSDENESSDEESQDASVPPTKLTDETKFWSTRAPRWTPDGSALVFLAVGTVGAHASCSGLYSLAWPITSSSSPSETLPEVTSLVPIVDRPKTMGVDFPGIFTHELARTPWISSSVLAIQSSWYSHASIVTVGISSGTVTRLTPPDDLSSMTLLDASSAVGGSLLVAASCPGTPHSVYVATNVAAGSPKWTLVASHISAWPSSLPKLSYKVVDIKPTRVEGAGDSFQAIMLYPASTSGSPSLLTGSEKLPVVLTPHGGPHGAFASEWVGSHACYAACGAVVVAVNYRGSTGFGQEPLMTLPGQVGTQDVADCMDALSAVNSALNIETGTAFVTGGSHGGFLGAHLVGQHPDVFSAAVLANPVTNLASMVSISDIPDWIYVESGLPYPFHGGSPSLTAEDLAAMWSVSPVRHVSHVTTATMLVLGAVDLRVPNSNGLEYWTKLRQLAKAPTRLIRYPGNNHSLADVDAGADYILNSLLWFVQGGIHASKTK